MSGDTLQFELKTARQGIAAAAAFVIREEDPEGPGRASARDEVRALKDAVNQLKSRLSSACEQAGEENRAILEAEILVLEDPYFYGTACSIAEQEGLSAAQAVTRAAQELEERIDGSGNAYFQSRAEDVRGLALDLLHILRRTQTTDLTEPSVLVARELSPSRFLCLNSSLICGIVTEKGSPLSHLAILAGNCGIPYYYGSYEAVSAIRNGDRLILADGLLTIRPDEDTWQAALKRVAGIRPRPEEHPMRQAFLYTP